MVRILEVILVEDKSKLQEQPTTLITGMMQTEINAEAEGLVRSIQKHLWHQAVLVKSISGRCRTDLSTCKIG